MYYNTEVKEKLLSFGFDICILTSLKNMSNWLESFSLSLLYCLIVAGNKIQSSQNAFADHFN